MDKANRKARNAIRAIDLFCGAGGSSWGARNAGVQIIAGFDMWRLAGKVYQDNFPEAKFYKRKLEYSRPSTLAEELGRVDLILASPECTNHSPAKGSQERSEASRRTAFQVVRFARALKPRWIVIENVISMKRWKQYPEFVRRLKGLGYYIHEQILDSADFGVPQSRRRLFLLCSLDGQPTEVTPPSGTRNKPVRDVINLNGKYKYSLLKTPERAKATLTRADRAIQELGPNGEFLLVYYGSDGAGGWQRLDVPLRTITTLDRFALVTPVKGGHQMRMLQVPELQAAMGFPSRFKIKHGTRREKIHLLGNAVCPPVIEAILRSLLRERAA